MSVFYATIGLFFLFLGVLSITRPLVVFKHRSGAVDPEPRSRVHLRAIQFGGIILILCGVAIFSLLL